MVNAQFITVHFMIMVILYISSNTYAVTSWQLEIVVFLEKSKIYSMWKTTKLEDWTFQYFIIRTLSDCESFTGWLTYHCNKIQHIPDQIPNYTGWTTSKRKILHSLTKICSLSPRPTKSGFLILAPHPAPLGFTFFVKFELI